MQPYEIIRIPTIVSNYPELPIEEVFKAWGVEKFASFGDDYISVALPPGWTVEILVPAEPGQRGIASVRDTHMTNRADILYNIEANESNTPDSELLEAAKLLKDEFVIKTRFGTRMSQDIKKRPIRLELVDNRIKKIIMDIQYEHFLEPTSSSEHFHLASNNAGEAWLNATFPDWKNPLAYWN